MPGAYTECKMKTLSLVPVPAGDSTDVQSTGPQPRAPRALVWLTAHSERHATTLQLDSLPMQE